MLQHAFAAALEKFTTLFHKAVFKANVDSNRLPKKEKWWKFRICCHEMVFESCKRIKMRLQPGLC